MADELPDAMFEAPNENYSEEGLYRSNRIRGIISIVDCLFFRDLGFDFDEVKVVEEGLLLVNATLPNRDLKTTIPGNVIIRPVDEGYFDLIGYTPDEHGKPTKIVWTYSLVPSRSLGEFLRYGCVPKKVAKT